MTEYRALHALLSSASTYPATIRRVVDGDTFRADVTFGSATIATLAADLVFRDIPVRLDAVAANKTGTPGGDACAAYVSGILTPGTPVTLSQVGAYKYRMELVAHVQLASGVDLGSLLVSEGWAVPWNGKGTQPVPPWPRVVP